LSTQNSLWTELPHLNRHEEPGCKNA